MLCPSGRRGIRPSRFSCLVSVPPPPTGYNSGQWEIQPSSHHSAPSPPSGGSVMQQKRTAHRTLGFWRGSIHAHASEGQTHKWRSNRCITSRLNPGLPGSWRLLVTFSTTLTNTYASRGRPRSVGSRAYGTSSATIFDHEPLRTSHPACRGGRSTGASMTESCGARQKFLSEAGRRTLALISPLPDVMVVVAISLGGSRDK